MFHFSLLLLLGTGINKAITQKHTYSLLNLTLQFHFIFTLTLKIRRKSIMAMFSHMNENYNYTVEKDAICRTRKSHKRNNSVMFTFDIGATSQVELRVLQFLDIGYGIYVDFSSSLGDSIHF